MSNVVIPEDKIANIRFVNKEKKVFTLIYGVRITYGWIALKFGISRRHVIRICQGDVRKDG